MEMSFSRTFQILSNCQSSSLFIPCSTMYQGRCTVQWAYINSEFQKSCGQMSKFQMRQIMSCDRALALFETIWRCLFPEHSKFRQKESNFNANCNILGVDPNEVRKRTYLIQNWPWPLTHLSILGYSIRSKTYFLLQPSIKVSSF